MSYSVLVTGDFCPAMDPPPFMPGASKGLHELYGGGLDLIRQSDLAITNLECPLTNSSQAISKIGPSLKAPPECIQSLAEAGFGLVTLANNHIYDYGRQGLIDTLEVCRKYKLETVGADETLIKSQQTWFTKINGRVLAVVNIAENEWNSATLQHGGSHPMNIINNARTIRAAAETSEFVLLIIHGGNELFTYPSPRTVEQYRFYAEQGATAIVAHHPHCIQGYEVHRGVPIFYSLGNFIFPYKRRIDSLWFEGFAVKLVFESRREPLFEIYPYQQLRDRTGLRWYENSEITDFMQRLENISQPLGDQAKLNEFWRIQAKNNALKFMWYLSHGSKPAQGIRRGLQYLGLLGPLVRLGKRTNQLRLHLVRCESHRDIILHALKQIVYKNED